MQRSAENTHTLTHTLIMMFTVVEMGGEKQHFYPNPQKVSSDPGREEAAVGMRVKLRRSSGASLMNTGFCCR